MKPFLIILPIVSISLLWSCRQSEMTSFEGYREEMKIGDRSFTERDLKSAERHYGQARSYAEKINWTFGMVRAGISTSKVLVEKGEYDEAKALLDSDVSLCRLDDECTQYKLYDLYGTLIAIGTSNRKNIPIDDSQKSSDSIRAAARGLINDAPRFKADDALMTSLRWTASELERSGFQGEARDLRLRIHELFGDSKAYNQ